MIRIATFSLPMAIAAVAFAALADMPASAAEWGSIKGRFVFDGDVKAEPISITKDKEYCGNHKLVDETVVTGEKNGLANMFVYLYLKRGDSVDVHPDYEKSASEPAVLDNNECRFEPHAMTLWTKQPLEIRNSDPGIGHNTNAMKLTANPSFNEIIPNDKPAVKNFEKSEPAPSPFACNIHPWMSAYVLIRDNPYMAASAKDGTFEIKNVPAGKHEFVVWHEGKGNVRNLKLGKEKTDRKGRVEFEIKAGETLDLGEVKVTEKDLGL
ncbi:MAG: hypothetical protein CMJ58_07995 [Planctomycetaceae bacterium]|nr:hypothetical protein [Planctomycetaceae bacterium]